MKNLISTLKNLNKPFYIVITVILLILLGLLSYFYFHKKEQGVGSVQTVSSQQVKELIKKEKDLVIVDIRTPLEFKGGKIDKAINIDFKNPNFKRDLSQLDKNKTYLFYCHSGNRTNQAVPTIKEMNFKKVYVLDHGIQSWVKNGGELVKPL